LPPSSNKHDLELAMNISKRSTSSVIRSALVAVVACTSLLAGCDRAREPSAAGPSASRPAASGATR
jgi:hypothetical protein